MKSALHPVLKFSMTAESQRIREALSAVALTPDGHLWLASDETVSLERLTADAHGNFERHTRFDLSEFLDLPGGTEQEIDFEGLTWDAPSADRIVKSHSVRADLIPLRD